MLGIIVIRISQVAKQRLDSLWAISVVQTTQVGDVVTVVRRIQVLSVPATREVEIGA